MCLILFSYKNSPHFSLKLLANRDEFYQRPTQSAHWWKDTDIFAGKDLKDGGSWFGIRRNGRMCAVTNIRNRNFYQKSAKKSRGNLVVDFLKFEGTSSAFFNDPSFSFEDYNGFNLLMFDGEQMSFISSKNNQLTILPAGIYGLSNDTLDTPWPKVVKGKHHLSNLIEKGWNTENAFKILKDSDRAEDNELPDTGVGLENERMLSPLFIESPIYGTRSSIVLEMNSNGQVQIEERDYNNEKQIRVNFMRN